MIRPMPITAATANARAGPTPPATVPTTGPNSAPITAAPKAVPSSSPRLSGGAAVATQPSPAAQVQAPARPSANRAANSSGALVASPNTSVDRLIMASPATATWR